MNNYEIKSQIIDQLKTLSYCKPTSNLRNWVVRCPYCGDSLNSSHGHFSILIDLQSDSPILYRCFKCNESGILTPQVLEDLTLGYNESLNRQLNMMNKTTSSRSYISDKIKKYIVPVPRCTNSNQHKLSYINNRLGVSLSYSDCADLKIILNFSEFIFANNIPINSDESGIMIKKSIINILDDKYVGFLSSNNNKITFRDASSDGSGYLGRYYKITLDLLNRSPNTFYAIKSTLDPLYTDSININIAEGTFDILSIYLNLFKNNSQNNLFVASCGYGFSTIIKYLIRVGVTTDIKLNIYSDNDKSDEDHKRLLNKAFYSIWVDNIIIHRNIFSNEKDFGVPIEKIEDYSYKLK